ncbi:MAG: TonB-dependent receptor domain-containing protein [Chitinophagaceae bacterium]
MRKQFVWLLTILFSTLTAATYAQNPAISGKVLSEGGKPVAAVTIQLLKAKDSTLAKAGVTDANGTFSLAAVKQGSYFIRYTLLGYETTASNVFEYAGTPITVATITLQQTSKKLDAVTVTSRKPLIEVKADKTVFNVENSINATGSNALELLQKSPGVQVDNNDNITMMGKTGVRIYVDGKMMQLDGTSLAAYLKSLNSNDIEAIEMISNPSAKYDASGNAGVINIRLKKNKKFGTNGSVNAGFVQGVTPKGNVALNLNYRDKKVNIFGNASANWGIYENTLNLDRTQKDTLFIQRSTNRANFPNYNFKVGADFFATKRSTFGVMMNGSLSDGNWGSYGVTDIYSANNKNFARRLHAFNNVPGSRTNLNNNLNYKYADTAGLEINVDADYGLFRGTGRSMQPNYYVDANNNPLYTAIYKNSTPTDIDIYTIKADVEMNKWKGKLGFGVKSSYVITKNSFDFWNVINGNDVKLLDKSNSFKYTENVNAAYVNYNRQINAKWSIQAGIRAEQTNSEGDLQRQDGIIQADQVVKRNYLDFFPSGALTYNINQKHTLNLNYSRRIDRPTYQDLNPFENKLDELTYQKGNAFLRPQYTDNIQLTHTFLGMINTTIGYSKVKDFSTQITDTIGNATYIQERNLATQQIWNLNISAPLPITKWWNGYANVWTNYQKYQGTFGPNKIDLNIWGVGAYMQQTFTLGKDYTAEVSGWFNGPSVWGGTWRTKSQGALDVGLQKQLMQKKATVKVSVTDIFFTAPWKANSNYAGTIINGGGTWESRTVRINFTYRFGSNQIKASRERQTGLESEKGRIKS